MLDIGLGFSLEEILKDAKQEQAKLKRLGKHIGEDQDVIDDASSGARSTKRSGPAVLRCPCCGKKSTVTCTK